MLIKKYDSLVTELTSFIHKFKEIESIQKDAEFDLMWRLTELYKAVQKEDEQKFINISGMHAHLKTTEQKRLIEKSAQATNVSETKTQQMISDTTQTGKKISNKSWAKSLYRRAVRRCHPDTHKVSDNNYKKELTMLYKNITESYESNNLDILMVESYKLFIKPKEVINEQLDILQKSKLDYHNKLQRILASQGYIWSTFSNEMKEVFLINLMKQKGVRFVDKQKVKEVLNRKISSRKIGQRPKNKLRRRVKNKK